MAYHVTIDELLADRLKALPEHDLTILGGLLVDLTISPWEVGTPLDPDSDDQSMRVAPFGSTGGLVTYLIDDQRMAVRVADIIWL